jgi:signal transduction histidine kinase
VTVARSVDCGRPLKNLHGNEYSTHKRYLAPALKALARRCTVPVQLDVRIKLRLPERVEVAAYYVIAEALTNAAKTERLRHTRGRRSD